MALIAPVVLILVMGRNASGLQEPPSINETTLHRVHLKNGNVLEGTVVRENSKEVVLRMTSGEMTIRWSQVDRVEVVKGRRGRVEEGPQKPSRPKIPGWNESRPSDEGSAPPVGPRAAPPFPAPSPLSEGVSETTRKRIDTLLGFWDGSPGAERPKLIEPLAGDIVAVGREAVPYLSRLLAEHRAGAPVEALSIALGRLGDPQAIPSLGLLLDSRNPGDRQAAIVALAQIDAPGARIHLLKALDDPTAEVWRTASDALVGQFKKENDSELVGTVLSTMAKAKAKTPYAFTLGHMATREAHQGLRDLLEEGNDEGKIAALQGLVLLRDPEDGLSIHRHLVRPSSDVQKEACLILGKLKYRPAVADLIWLLRNEDSGLKKNALWALKEITGQPMSADAALWETWWEETGSKEKK